MGAKKKKLTEAQLSKLAQKLEADPDAKRIAAAVRMEVKDFVQQVLYFVKNPETGPKVHMFNDEVLKQHGFNPPSADQVKDFVAKVVREGEAVGAATGRMSGFDPPRKRIV